jgi:hypothetical protein
MRVDARHLRIRFGPWRGAGVRQPTIKARSLRAGIRYPGAACKRRADSGVNHGVVHGQTLRLGRVIHRRLRGAPGGSPRRLLNNSGPTIRAGWLSPPPGVIYEMASSYNYVICGAKPTDEGRRQAVIALNSLKYLRYRHLFKALYTKFFFRSALVPLAAPRPVIRRACPPQAGSRRMAGHHTPTEGLPSGPSLHYSTTPGRLIKPNQTSNVTAVNRSHILTVLTVLTVLTPPSPNPEP